MGRQQLKNRTASQGVHVCAKIVRNYGLELVRVNRVNTVRVKVYMTLLPYLKMSGAYCCKTRLNAASVRFSPSVRLPVLIYREDKTRNRKTA